MMVYQKPEAWTRLVTHSNEHLPVKQKNKEVYYMPCIVCHTILHCHQDEWWGVGEGGEEMQRDFSVVGFYVCLFYVFFFTFAFVCLIAYFDLFPYGDVGGMRGGQGWLGEKWNWGAWCETTKESIKSYLKIIPEKVDFSWTTSVLFFSFLCFDFTVSNDSPEMTL